MDLFEWSQNIMKVDQNKVINDSIKNVNNELNGLTKDRMCKVYSSYVYNELKKNHVLARLINTSDLGFDYEHQFILVPINKLTKDYYLIDLTYSQFVKNMEDEKLKRRVERNLAKMNIPSTTSKEAFYILECEENYTEKQDLKNNSRTRILDMTEKLEKVKNGDYNAE